MRASVTAESREYVQCAVFSGTADDPTTHPVRMAVSPAGQAPGTFASASWASGASSPTAQVLVGPGSAIGALTPGVYSVFVSIDASPEAPVLLAGGDLTVTP